MADLGPPQVIPAPPVNAFPAGLLETAVVVTHKDTPPRVPGANDNATPYEGVPTAADGGPDYWWGNRIAWSPQNCSDAITRDPCNFTAVGQTRNRPAKIEYEPFTVEAFDSCSTFGFETAEYEQRAIAALARRESKAVEKELWTGALFSGANMALARTTTPANGGPTVVDYTPGAGVTPGAGLANLNNGIALLVQALADLNGGEGFIHARPYLVELWLSEHLINNQPGGRMETFTGIPIVAGAGYPGTGPTGQAVTLASEWAFVTEPVVVHRGPVEVFAPGINGQTVDRAANEVIVRAERLYAPIWNGCVLAAVNINPATTE